MTAPRQIIPGATLMITRRCLGRMFLLRPSKATNELFHYVLAVAAERYGIYLHAICVMSNHFHCILTDPLGHLPKFEQYLDGLVARSLNALHGRWESFWAPGSYSAVRLLSPRTIVQKAAYTLANPVSAGLVRHGAEWPGLWAAAGLKSGQPVQVKRPDGFFRKGGPLPELAALRFHCPPGFESMEAFRTQLMAEVTRLEDRAARKHATAGRAFLGARVVMAQRPQASPRPDEPRRGLNPRIASRDRWRRVEALTRFKEFLVAYRGAWCEFARGLRDALFPAGTYWMRVAHGVRCAEF
jgi:REP element-mobilizing transposase RayT